MEDIAFDKKLLEKTKIISIADDSDFFLKNVLIENLGPNSNGARNWFIVASVALLLLGLFPVVSFAALLTGKIIALLALSVGVITTAKGLWDGYLARERTDQKNPISTYVFDDLIFPSLRSPRNIVQVFFGILLAALIFTLLVCVFPGIDLFANTSIPVLQPFFDWTSSIIHLFSDGFLSVFPEILSQYSAPIMASVFIGVISLIGYDSSCRVIKWIFPIENPVEPKTVENKKDDSTQTQGKKLTTVSQDPASFKSFLQTEGRSSTNVAENLVPVKEDDNESEKVESRRSSSSSPSPGSKSQEDGS